MHLMDKADLDMLELLYLPGPNKNILAYLFKQKKKKRTAETIQVNDFFFYDKEINFDLIRHYLKMNVYIYVCHHIEGEHVIRSYHCLFSFSYNES
jgi:hypothetical protein